MNVEDFDDIPLTDAEKENVAILIDTALRYPEDIQRLVRSTGQDPSSDPEELVYQMILGKLNESHSFDTSMVEYMGETREFLGGLGILVGKAAGAVAGLFHKKDRAAGTKGFIGRTFDKIKGKVQERRDRRTADRAPAPDYSPAPEPPASSRNADLDTMTKKELKEALMKARKEKTILWITSGGLLVGVITLAIVAFRR